MARSTTSIRLQDDLRQQLASAAAAEGTTVTELIERFTREGLACGAHPGIVFKAAPSGRRAALAGGPDVWEVLNALRHHSNSEVAKVAAVAEELGLPERQVVIALNYAADHCHEIEDRIAANERALDSGERWSRVSAAGDGWGSGRRRGLRWSIAGGGGPGRSRRGPPPRPGQWRGRRPEAKKSSGAASSCSTWTLRRRSAITAP